MKNDVDEYIFLSYIILFSSWRWINSPSRAKLFDFILINYIFFCFYFLVYYSITKYNDRWYIIEA